jgi:hypothetical protein
VAATIEFEEHIIRSERLPGLPQNVIDVAPVLPLGTRRQLLGCQLSFWRQIGEWRVG